MTDIAKLANERRKGDRRKRSGYNYDMLRLTYGSERRKSCAPGLRRTPRPAQEALKPCPHMNFAARTTVMRLTEGDAGPVTGYTADIRIECSDCHLPFQFLGLPAGSRHNGAAVSIDGQEARLAISPLGALPSRLDDMLLSGARPASKNDH